MIGLVPGATYSFTVGSFPEQQVVVNPGRWGREERREGGRGNEERRVRWESVFIGNSACMPGQMICTGNKFVLIWGPVCFGWWPV